MPVRVVRETDMDLVPGKKYRVIVGNYSLKDKIIRYNEDAVGVCIFEEIVTDTEVSIRRGQETALKFYWFRDMAGKRLYTSNLNRIVGEAERHYMGFKEELVKYYKDWMAEPEASSLFKHLYTTAPWRSDEVSMFGQAKMPLRKRVVYGVKYDYNPLAPEAHHWTPELFDIRMKLQKFTGLKFNSCVANFYENGDAYIGWHHDKRDPEMIASISLGAVRNFSYASDEVTVYTLKPAHGSLILTPREINREFKHSLPKDYSCKEPRINLTYRFLPEPEML